jgi:CheY-like chemotaxis protein
LGLAHHQVKPVTRTNLLKAILQVTGLRQPAMIQRHSGHEAVRPLRILVAEDNSVNQRVALFLLKKQGHSVVVASNGAEAVHAAAREPFDIIFMDIQMPVMNGYEAAQAIRERERGTGEHTPIIALTAHAMNGTRETCVEAGMDDYLSKPIQSQQLYEFLARWGQPQCETQPAGVMQE